MTYNMYINVESHKWNSIRRVMNVDNNMIYLYLYCPNTVKVTFLSDNGSYYFMTLFYEYDLNIVIFYKHVIISVEF